MNKCKIEKIDCVYNEELCKDCICPICENRKCDRVFCGEEYNEKGIRNQKYKCNNFIDWLTKLKGKRIINSLEENRHSTIESTLDYIVEHSNEYWVTYKDGKDGKIDKIYNIYNR